MAKHYRKLPLILPLSLVPALCLAEGSAEIGAVQGLEVNSTLKVTVEAGETLEFCSSDDGLKEAAVPCFDQNGTMGDCEIDSPTGPTAVPTPTDYSTDSSECKLSACTMGNLPRSNDRCGGTQAACGYTLFFEARHKQQADILLTPPTLTGCNTDADCGGISLGNQPAECRYRREGLKVNTANFTAGTPTTIQSVQYKGVCQIPFSVKNEGNNKKGYCNYQNHENASKHSVTIPEGMDGEWSINFAGEPESKSTSGGSTRYFDVTVKDASGAEIKGRLHTDMWWLNAHTSYYGADSAFYVKAVVTKDADVTKDTAHVFKIDFDDVRGFRWQLASNTIGLKNNPRLLDKSHQSWCQHGDPELITVTPTGESSYEQFECYTDAWQTATVLEWKNACTANSPDLYACEVVNQWEERSEASCRNSDNQNSNACLCIGGNDEKCALVRNILLDTFVQEKYQIYLNYPDPAPKIADKPEILSARFADAFGSNTISPNGDGNQDKGSFFFTSNVPGTYTVIVDTDRDGVFDSAKDWTATGEIKEKEKEIEVPWDGTDKYGRTVVLGQQYKFQIQVSTGETHFPMADIETNEKGFIITKASADVNGRVLNESTKMYWDDSLVRTDAVLLNNDDRVAMTVDGSADGQRRYWKQGNYSRYNLGSSTTDMPVIFDTWVLGDSDVATKVGCALGCDDGDVDYIYVCDPDSNPDCDEKKQDSDEDGIPDPYDGCTRGVDCDNCPYTPNADQADFDGDGIGDACDNCWKRANADQTPSDASTADKPIGVACDPDHDGVSSDGTLDGDGNVVPGSVDNCPNVSNPKQEDENGDGIGDACEGDADSDTIPDSKDNCPTTSNTDQADWNNNGIGDACDDSDDDKVYDNVDNCVTTPNTDQKDTDGDGIGDACDDDIDGDGVLNDDDNCVYVKNPNQEDENENGIGDACEVDAALDITGNSPIPFDTFEGCSQNGRSSGMPFLFLLPILALRRRKH